MAQENKVHSIEDAKNQNAPLKFGADILKAYRDEFGKDATDAQWAIYIDLCERRRAIPGKDIHFQLHNAWEWDEDTRSKKKIKKATHVSTCAFLQTLAERTGLYEGRTPTVYVYVDGDDNMRDSARPISKKGDKFVGAEVTIKRKDRPDTVVFARFDAYAVTYKKDNVERLTQMWVKFGPEQTAKCAFAAAIRQAFPEDLGELHGEEEMEQAVAASAIVEKQAVAPADPAFIPTVGAPAVAPAATVEHDAKPMPGISSPSEPTPEQLAAQRALAKVDPAKLAEAAQETYVPTDADYAAAVDQLGPDMAKDATAGTQANELPAVAPAVPPKAEVPALAAAVEAAAIVATAPTVEAKTETPATPKEYTEFCNQTAKFSNDVLVPGGILAGKGLTISAKVKKFILKTVSKTDLKKLTAQEWSTVLATLNDVAKGENGGVKAVALIEKTI